MNAIELRENLIASGFSDVVSNLMSVAINNVMEKDVDLKATLKIFIMNDLSRVEALECVNSYTGYLSWLKRANSEIDKEFVALALKTYNQIISA